MISVITINANQVNEVAGTIIKIVQIAGTELVTVFVFRLEKASEGMYGVLACIAEYFQKSIFSIETLADSFGIAVNDLWQVMKGVKNDAFNAIAFDVMYEDLLTDI